MSDAPQGSVFVCEADGTITRVLRDELALVEPGGAARTLPTRVDSGSFRKALDFLRAASAEPVFAWELIVDLDGALRPLWFAGAAEGGPLLVAVARSRSQLAALCRALGEGSGAVASAARAMKSAGTDDAAEVQALDELVRMNGELSNLHRELARKNLDLRRMMEERDRVVSAAAHDLRSPLNAIANFAAILREDVGDRLGDDERQYLERIEHSSQFMQALVEGMLDVSRANWGKLSLSRQEVAFEELLRLVVGVHRAMAQRKKIELVTELGRDLPRIAIDENKVEQVLNNLIGNAIHYSYEGSRVRVVADLDEACHCRVSVHDEGQGIPADELGKLFVPFSRTSVRPTGGESTTGLGLAIAKGIVEAHGGRIWVESEPGVGSSFHFTLPPDAG